MTQIPPIYIAAFAHAGGFGEVILAEAVAIVLAESGGDTNAKGGPNSNGTYDWGLFQINDIHKPTQAEKVNPLANAQRAWKIYQQAGNSFKPWSTYNSGSYKKFLPRAREAVTALKKAGPEAERKIVAQAKDIAGGIDIDTGPPTDEVGLGDRLTPDAVTAVPSAITGAVNAFNSTFAKLTFNLGAVAVAIVLLILGFIILMRTPIAGVVGKATPIGRAAAVAKKVG